MSAPGHAAGPLAPDSPEPSPCAEAERFDAARRAGLRPRVERTAPLPPLYRVCPRCHESAPEVTVWIEHLHLAECCLRCAAAVVEAA